MPTIKTTRKSIQDKVSAMDFDLRTLELWEEAEAKGIDSSGSGSFGLDTRLFTSAEQREYHRHMSTFVVRETNGAITLKRFNYFKYPNGDIVKLDPMLEAVH